ncbi:hypothetical protein BDW59DRAFT_167447 [Aspergillus cavernicola]|uniref:Uncharacterized protein n=1 Tax=Aspergillus cavernicola TaxID=176166 RepID=A0ABR4HDS6_9EURO
MALHITPDTRRPSSVNLPPLDVPKKRRVNELAVLMHEKNNADGEWVAACTPLRARGSFNVEYWAAATDVEEGFLQKTRVSSEISRTDFKGTAAEWEEMEKAKRLFERMRAQRHRIVSFSKQGRLYGCNLRHNTTKGGFSVQKWTYPPLYAANIMKTAALMSPQSSEDWGRQSTSTLPFTLRVDTVLVL